MSGPRPACLAAACAVLLGTTRPGAPPAPWNLSSFCPSPYNFTATSWDHTCGDPGDGLEPPGPRCRNFSNIVPSIELEDRSSKYTGIPHFGDNASNLVPKIIHGGVGIHCSAEAAPPGTCLAGTAAQPAGLRSIRFGEQDRLPATILAGLRPSHAVSAVFQLAWTRT